MTTAVEESCTDLTSKNQIISGHISALDQNVKEVSGMLAEHESEVIERVSLFLLRSLYAQALHDCEFRFAWDGG